MSENIDKTVEEYFKFKCEKFRKEIRKTRNDNLLNSKRMNYETNPFIILFEKQTDLPSIEECPELFFSGIIIKLRDSDYKGDNVKIIAFLNILRKYSSTDEDSRKLMIKQDVLLELCEKYITNENIDKVIKDEARWLLCNLASLDGPILESINPYIMNNILYSLIHNIDEKDKEKAEDCLWTLYNISKDSNILSERIISMELVGKLIKFLKENVPNIQILRDIIMLLRSLSDRSIIKTCAEYREEILTTLPFLKICLKIDDSEILLHTLWIISYLTDLDDVTLKNIKENMENDFLENLVKWIMNPEDKIRNPSIRTICNFLSKDDDFIKNIIKLNILDEFKILLDSKKKDVKKEILWGLSNILAVDSETSETVFKHEIFTKLWSMSKIEDYEVKREIVFCFANFISTCNNDSFFGECLEKGLINFFEQMLEFQETSLVLSIIDSLSFLLKNEEIKFQIIQKSNIPKIIESLQHHPNAKIYDRCFDLLEKYFETDLITNNNN